AAEAGSANNSAVHYHFGSKQGLIVAIFRHRLPQLLSERRLLAARCDPDDLRSRFEAHFLPVLAMAEAPDNHYVSFVEQLQRRDLAEGSDLLDLPPEGRRSNEDFRRDLDELLPHLDGPLRQLRIIEPQGPCPPAPGAQEGPVTSGADVVPFELFAGSLFDGLTGFLSAPASEATFRRLGPADEAGPHLPLL